MTHRQWLMVGLLALSVAGCGPSAAKYNNQGNEAYEAEEYGEALDKYVSAELENPDLAEPYYNAGNAFHRQGDLEKASSQIEQSLRKAEGELAQLANYNLGNTHFLGEAWSEAIEAYRQALRLKPDDVDAKHNLELALQKQQEEQQQQQQQQGGSGEGDEEQDQQEQGGQQGQQPQQGQQGQGEQNGGQGQQENPDDSDDGGQGDQPDHQQPGQAELTPEQAEQLLDALGQDNQTLQERLNQRFQAPGLPPSQDW